MTAALEGFARAPSPDHGRDVHAWARLQEAALADGRISDLDLANLAQEIAALGRSEYHALESALLRLLQHLLKWDHQPTRRCRSWSLTIEAQRGNIEQILRENPSLRGRRSDAMSNGHRKGRMAMLRETSLSKASVPDINPYSWDEAMTRPIVWPEP